MQDAKLAELRGKQEGDAGDDGGGGGGPAAQRLAAAEAALQEERERREDSDAALDEAVERLRAAEARANAVSSLNPKLYTLTQRWTRPWSGCGPPRRAPMQ